jgi:predicted metal-dependent HD superfamily phosphohydrolase
VFHDIVYDTSTVEKYENNEKNSIDYFFDVLDKLDRKGIPVPMSFSKAVMDEIKNTKDLESNTDLCKADRNILYSRLYSRLVEYDDAITKELGHFSDYRINRKKFLLNCAILTNNFLLIKLANEKYKDV